jgi:protein-tyrosine-phosphatase
MSQLWAQVAAYYYDVENVKCYSGGTEATAFNKRSVKALQKAGFQIDKLDETDNPMYHVTYAEGFAPIQAFSKKYEHEANPKENFAAIMTCSHADEACPIVFGASERISITYDDPKIADNTPEEEAKYDERSQQIAREMLYAFSKIK